MCLWFFAGLMIAARAFTGVLRWRFSLVLLSSPFAWYYLNEARPYAMQLGAALIIFSSLYQLGFVQNEFSRERRWIIALCLGSLLLAASSLLAMLWLGAYFVATIFKRAKKTLAATGKKLLDILDNGAVATFCSRFVLSLDFEPRRACDGRGQNRFQKRSVYFLRTFWFCRFGTGTIGNS